MIKIRDNVDLKILEEKYWFNLDASPKYNPKFYEDDTPFREKNCGYIISHEDGIRINDETLQITFDSERSYDIEKDLDVLFALIQEGLIEYVDRFLRIYSLTDQYTVEIPNFEDDKLETFTGTISEIVYHIKEYYDRAHLEYVQNIEKEIERAHTRGYICMILSWDECCSRRALAEEIVFLDEEAKKLKEQQDKEYIKKWDKRMEIWSKK